MPAKKKPQGVFSERELAAAITALAARKTMPEPIDWMARRAELRRQLKEILQRKKAA